VGVFEDRRHADKAVEDLRKAGFREDQIGVAMRHDEATGDATATDQATESGEGAVTGALTGLGLGALVGLGVLTGFIPVVGPAIAAGTLGVVLSNAAAGAGLAGLVGALVGAGIPEHEAEYYKGEFEAGRAIVTVNADGRGDEVTGILRRHGAYDMSSRGSSVGNTAASETSTHSSKSTSSRAKGSKSRATKSGSTHESGVEGDTIEVKEERLHAEKHPVEVGEVRVHKEVHTENKSIDVPVEREEIVIERKPAHGKAATSSYPTRNRAASCVPKSICREPPQVEGKLCLGALNQF
jgi:stress response protein YsnF